METLAQTLWDFVGIPFRLVLFDQKWLPCFGWTTLAEERIRAVLPHLRGRLLDIEAGPNHLVHRYREPAGTDVDNRHVDSIGVDVHDWGEDVLVVEDSSLLPFEDASFDSITCIAALNHIPNRTAVLAEARRLIKPDGRLVISMINPLLGGVGHGVWWYDEHHHRGGMVEGEVGGIWPRDVVRLCREGGFELVEHGRFVYAMNHLFVFRPAG